MRLQVLKGYNIFLPAWVFECVKEEKRMTNFERIKNMSIDEMTNAIKNGHLGDPCDYCSFGKEPCACLCVEGIVMWLNSEVKE